MTRSLFTRLILLHRKRFLRLSRDMNVVLWLAFAALLFLPMVRLQEMAGDNPEGILIAAGALLLLSGIHRSRSDLQFMRHLSDHPERIWAGEYLLITFPFSVLLLSAGNWQAACLWWAGCIAAGYLPMRKQRVGTQVFWGRVIPYPLYEWIAGMRRTGLLILPLYAAALVLPFFLPYISFFLLWFVFGLIAGFYRENEPLNLLHAGAPGARAFLHKKIRVHLTAGWILVIPVGLVYGFRYPEQAWLPLIFLFLNTLQHLFYLLNKYATYRPAHTSGGDSVLGTLVSLSVVLPFLLPLPLLLCIRDYGRARRNLQFYLQEKYP